MAGTTSSRWGQRVRPPWLKLVLCKRRVLPWVRQRRWKRKDKIRNVI